jgi:hypothetical protein
VARQDAIQIQANVGTERRVYPRGNRQVDQPGAVADDNEYEVSGYFAKSKTSQSIGQARQQIPNSQY